MLDSLDQIAEDVLSCQHKYERAGGRSRHFVLVTCPKCKQERWARVDYMSQAKHFPHCARCAPHGMALDLNPSWRGGRINHKGYIFVKVPSTDPLFCMTNNHGYIGEHRLIIARHLGRPLTRKELVHHIDGDKKNNNLSNLELTTNEEHTHKYREAYEIGYKQGFADGTRQSSERD